MILRGSQQATTVYVLAAHFELGLSRLHLASLSWHKRKKGTRESNAGKDSFSPRCMVHTRYLWCSLLEYTVSRMRVEKNLEANILLAAQSLSYSTVGWKMHCILILIDTKLGALSPFTRTKTQRQPTHNTVLLSCIPFVLKLHTDTQVVKTGLGKKPAASFFGTHEKVTSEDNVNGGGLPLFNCLWRQGRAI